MSASQAYYSKDLKPGRNKMLMTVKNITIGMTLFIVAFLFFFPPDNLDGDSSSKLNYMAVIDAGSSGSRIHVYKYSGSIKSKKVEPDHATMKEKPGLSSFASKTTEAGAALEPLIKFAKDHIPADMVKSTPIVLKATAGMRLVQQDQPAAVEGIFKSVKTTLGNSGLQFTPSNAQIISGQEEGMLGWMALNYLYDNTNKSNLRKSAPIWSVLEMGGASVQVSVPLPSSMGVPSQYVLPYVSASSGKKGSMYTHSFLGAGVQSAKGAVEKALVAQQGSSDTLNHPCLPSGFTETENSIKYMGTGNFEECQAIIKSAVFAKQQDKVAECEKTSSQCFWNGVAGPGLKPSEQKVWAFENFFYTMSGVGEMKADESSKEFAIQDYERVAKDMCVKPWDSIEAAYPKDSQPKEYNKDWCFSALYAFSFLTSGLGLDAQQTIMIGNEVEGVGIDWALGAVLQHQGKR